MCRCRGWRCGGGRSGIGLHGCGRVGDWLRRFDLDNLAVGLGRSALAGLSDHAAALHLDHNRFGPAMAEALLDLARFHGPLDTERRSEEHTSELQSLMRISYAVFCLKKKKLYFSLTTSTSSHHCHRTPQHHS